MVQPTKARVAESTLETESSIDDEVLNEKYLELLDSLLNDKKDIAIKKHPELMAAYKAIEVYEIYFLAGGDWDEAGAIEFKKKMAKTAVRKLIKGNDSPKAQTPVEKK